MRRQRGAPRTLSFIIGRQKGAPRSLSFIIERQMGAQRALSFIIGRQRGAPRTFSFIIERQNPAGGENFLSLFWMFQKMTPPEAENFELFRPIYSKKCSLAIANRISDPKNFLAPTGARGCPPPNPKHPLDPLTLVRERDIAPWARKS